MVSSWKKAASTRSEGQHSPTPIDQDRRRGDAHIVGYSAPATGGRAEEGLGHRGGAEQLIGTRQGPRYLAAFLVLRGAVLAQGVGVQVP